ncbi:hypothetical protein ATANTOWER_029177 [Ataeniobius toweri]|uniref:Uncharacterized protein n=1 Tax=Ataeniobius toweri TaxID=208326 RepID=A0ABU7BP65_9TELE|nr:hypothetical protein [Ataeniobius toweri]
MAKSDPLVLLGKMVVPDLLAQLEPEDSPESWDSPDPRELVVNLVKLVREVLVELLALLVLLVKMVILVLLDLLALVDLLERRENKDLPVLQDSRVFLDPKDLLVRLASLVIRVFLVRPDHLAKLDPEVTEASLVNAVVLDLLVQLDLVVPVVLLVTMDLRN